MAENNQTDSDFRILVLMPIGRDAELVCQFFGQAGLQTHACKNFDELETRIGESVGAVLLVEEALDEQIFSRFIDVVRAQPIWSDLPIVLLASSQRNTESLLNTIGTLLNITIVERPLPKAILISAMRGALRARRKQYQTRDLLAQLEEADQQKDLFLATLSHELRTPLNSMLGWIEMLRTHAHDNFDRAHALDVIERNARSQTQIINDILLLSRIITGKFEISTDTIDADEAIKSAIDVMRPEVKLKNIDLQISLSDGDCPIKGDFDRLQQVFWNLLSNAVKFTPEGGTIKIETACRESIFTVVIADNGKGINPEFLPFIFERFRQADNSYTREAGGLGLGLAIVRNIIEQHGGGVSVTSDGEGKGSRFTVELPLIEKSANDADDAKDTLVSANRASLAGLRVLLVEDDNDSREMLAFLLGADGIKIEAVASGAAALAEIERNPPQLLISDVGMPGMDGYQFIKRVRALPAEQGGQIPAIALTGYAGSQDHLLAINSGYQAHLAKPIDFEKLFETIRQVLKL